MKTATIATITVTAPIRTGLAPSCRVPRLIRRAGSRGRSPRRRAGRRGAAGAVGARPGRRLWRGRAVAAPPRRRSLGRVGRGHARLCRAEELVALLEQLLARLDRVRRALVHEDAEPQHVADVVERVGRERLPVEEVPDRLHAGEAGAAGRGVRLVARRRAARRRAAVRLDGPACGRRSSGGTGAAASRGRARPCASRRSSLTSSVVLRTARRPTTDISPSALNARQALGGERAQPGQEGVELVGGRLEVAQHRASAPSSGRRGGPCTARARRGRPAGGWKVSPERPRAARPRSRRSCPPRARSGSRPSCGSRARRRPSARRR